MILPLSLKFVVTFCFYKTVVMASSLFKLIIKLIILTQFQETLVIIIKKRIVMTANMAAKCLKMALLALATQT